MTDLEDDARACSECAEKGRTEPLNVTVRHHDTNGCVVAWWCFVCGTGDARRFRCRLHAKPAPESEG